MERKKKWQIIQNVKEYKREIIINTIGSIFI